MAFGTADASNVAAAQGDGAPGCGGAGNGDVRAIMHRYNDMPWAGGGAAHTAGAPIRVHPGDAVLQVNGVKLTHLGAIAEAQATEFANERPPSGHLCSGQAIGNPLICLLYTSDAADE